MSMSDTDNFNLCPRLHKISPGLIELLNTTPNIQRRRAQDGIDWDYIDTNTGEVILTLIGDVDE